MSDDIVMRLRASSLAWRISLMPEAADEIDRLRSALDIAIRERNEARAEVKRLRAENARLRAQIVEYFREPGTHEVERLTRQRDEARAEVERLREALRWYASERNHFPLELYYCGPGELDPAAFFLQEPPVMGDGGKRARDALEAKP